MGVIKNPIFTTEAGIELHLKPISSVILQRWNIEYDKRCPPPTPPQREVKIVGTPVLQHDMLDPYYKFQMAAWETQKQDALFTFLYSRGVTNKIPKDWNADEEVVFYNATEWQLKAIWVAEQLLTVSDITGLQEAILSLAGITPEAIAEAEKN